MMWPRPVLAYQISLEFLLRTGRRFQSAQVYNNLGMVWAEQRDWAKAEAVLPEEPRNQARGRRHSLRQARTLINLVRAPRCQVRRISSAFSRP